MFFILKNWLKSYVTGIEPSKFTVSVGIVSLVYLFVYFWAISVLTTTKLNSDLLYARNIRYTISKAAAVLELYVSFH